MRRRARDGDLTRDQSSTVCVKVDVSTICSASENL
jgi:hypothetical protein